MTVTVREKQAALVFEIVGADSASFDRLRDRIEALGGSLTLASDRISGRLPLP